MKRSPIRHRKRIRAASRGPGRQGRVATAREDQEPVLRVRGQATGEGFALQRACQQVQLLIGWLR